MCLGKFILTLYIIWAVGFYFYTKNWFGKKFLYLKSDAYLNAKHASGFIRRDR